MELVEVMVVEVMVVEVMVLEVEVKLLERKTLPVPGEFSHPSRGAECSCVNAPSKPIWSRRSAWLSQANTENREK